MRIVCCYATLRAETRASLAGYDVEYVDTSGDEFAYWRAIAERWTGVQPLMIVEGDMVVPRGAPASLARCRKAWCTYAYSVNQRGCRCGGTGEAGIRRARHRPVLSRATGRYPVRGAYDVDAVGRRVAGSPHDRHVRDGARR